MECDAAQSAVQALALIGDEHAKAALFERLADWHAKWMGRERDSFWTPGEDPFTDDRHLGDELIHSLGTAAGWLLTEAEQQRLLENAVTENQRQQAQQFIDAAKAKPIAITVNMFSPPHMQILIRQYNYESVGPAKQKLAQFPAGSGFVVEGIPVEGADTRETVAEIQSFLAQHGMRIETRKLE
jgi:hypothetical protein